MRTLDAMKVPSHCNRLLRWVEKHGESIQITKNGVAYCIMEPVSKVQTQMLTSLYRRTRRNR
jgi:hypothetical protein